MNSILYIGMDVHTTNYTVCAYSIEKDSEYGRVQMEPKYQNILKYISRLRKHVGEETEIVCGYEAGGLGYSLYRDLKRSGIECIIMAPSTMPKAPNERKTDYRDAAKIARCLAYNTYQQVYVPDEEDESVKEYIRMRDSEKATVKKLKQQILAFCHRQGLVYTETRNNWTKRHMEWLKKLVLPNALLRETLDEYLIRLEEGLRQVQRYDERIESMADEPKYAEKVQKLICFNGIKKHTALALISEIGDFYRFANANRFSAFLGLVPGEYSSGNAIYRTGITKQGNRHLRCLLTEAAQSIGRAKPGYISMELRRRQKGCEPKIIAYANKGNERLKRRYRYLSVLKKNTVTTTAIARELACFIWGMMTEHYD